MSKTKKYLKNLNKTLKQHNLYGEICLLNDEVKCIDIVPVNQTSISLMQNISKAHNLQSGYDVTDFMIDNGFVYQTEFTNLEVYWKNEKHKRKII
jgi:hypothetical protein